MNKFLLVLAAVMILSVSYASAATIACAVQSPDNHATFSVLNEIWRNFSITPTGVNISNYTIIMGVNGDTTTYNAFQDFNFTAYPDPPIDHGAAYSSTSSSSDWEPADYTMQIKCCADDGSCALSNTRAFTVKGEAVMSSLTQTVLSLLAGFLALAILGFALIAIGIYLRNNFDSVDSKKMISIFVLILLVTVLGIVIINYVVSQIGLTWNPSTGTIFIPDVPPGPLPG